MKRTCPDCFGDIERIPTCPTCNGSGLVDRPALALGCAWVALAILVVAAAAGFWLIATFINWLAVFAVCPA